MAETTLDTGAADAPKSLDDGLEDSLQHSVDEHDGDGLEDAQPVIQHLPRADEPVAAVEIYCNSFTTAAPEKLSAIAGVVSAYNRYLVGVRGRSPDDLEAVDVAQLGTMIGAMLGLQVQPSAQAKPRQGFQRR